MRPSATPTSQAGDLAHSGDDALRTRRRLLESAGEVFAERGYRAATIRDICGRAGANLAAVNYHFRDKAGLYTELLTFAYEASLERHPPDLGVRPGDPAEKRLFAFVRSFLLRLLDEGRAAWHARLICREMSDPSPFLGDAVRAPVQRVHDLLRGILRDLARESGGELVGDEGVLCAWSVIGQCVHYRIARPIVDALYPGRFGLAEVESVADHITAFTVAGVRGLALRPAPTARPDCPGCAGRAGSSAAPEVQP